ncbi:MAG: FAD-binding oxidoreductase [Candidatus Omnitrophica bacterium]|nr:FAD-binding oxidoreductase [Candidatus Omnitrophota bacterium]
MREIRVKLIERIRRTPSIESFRFSAEQRLDFLPGQFLQLLLDPARPENRELNKYLSFSASPAREYIEVTKRIGDSAFSRQLASLQAGQEAVIKAPMGSCVFKDEYKKIGFLIGGIGITPVISIIGYIIDKKLDTDVELFYSNRTEEEIAFKQELDAWQALNKKIRVFYTITDCRPKDKKCFFGAIGKELLEQKACNVGERTIFIFGPPRMVEAMKAISLEIGCPEQNVLTENFIGY